MANKKTNTKAKSATNKAKNTNKKPQPAPATENNEEIVRVAGIAVFAFSVIFFCLAVINGAGVWNVLHNVYVGIFGVFAACIFPLISVVVSLFYSFNKVTPSKFAAKSVETVIMVLLLATFVHVVKNQTGSDFTETITYNYQIAPTTFNGGFIGAVLGWLLLTMGKAPAIIICVVLFIVDFMLLTGLTVIQFFSGMAKPAKVTNEKVAPAINERIEKRRMSRENIDVPLDAEPPSEVEEKPKKRGRKKTDVTIENDNAVPRDIIDEINATSAKNKLERENAKTVEKAKSIEEIVEDASQDNENSKPVEKFTVTKEAMESSVNDYELPTVDLLKNGVKKSTKDISGELKENAKMLIDTLHSFNVDATITDISRGPTVTRYELKPAAGIRISKITNLADDIALNLAATHVRIEAPIPGKAAVGIEVPNTVKNSVTMRELIDTPEFSQQSSLLSAGLGKDIAGKCVYCDIAKMPHLLVAGTTGSGKSVCMNSIITSILYRAKPDEVKFLMIDPKQVEFSKYAGIPHLLVPVVTDPRLSLIHI